MTTSSHNYVIMESTTMVFPELEPPAMPRVNVD